jgi:hypothetical protein
MIQGTVTDISAGTKEKADRFPNGVPAVSDASMSEWMLYVYKQFPRPTNATGVTVNISVVDANGNYRDIGTTTSDADGFYSFNWMPDIEGKYTRLICCPNHTGLHMQTASPLTRSNNTSTPPEAPAQSMAETYIIGSNCNDHCDYYHRRINFADPKKRANTPNKNNPFPFFFSSKSELCLQEAQT